MSNNDCFIRTWGPPVLYMCMKQLYVVVIFRFLFVVLLCIFDCLFGTADVNPPGQHLKTENGELLLIVVTGF